MGESGQVTFEDDLAREGRWPGLAQGDFISREMLPNWTRQCCLVTFILYLYLINNFKQFLVSNTNPWSLIPILQQFVRKLVGACSKLGNLARFPSFEHALTEFYDCKRPSER